MVAENREAGTEGTCRGMDNPFHVFGLIILMVAVAIGLLLAIVAPFGVYRYLSAPERRAPGLRRKWVEGDHQKRTFGAGHHCGRRRDRCAGLFACRFTPTARSALGFARPGPNVGGCHSNSGVPPSLRPGESWLRLAPLVAPWNSFERGIGDLLDLNVLVFLPAWRLAAPTLPDEHSIHLGLSHK